jgi:small-conductance mechanosensitive channel
MKIGLCSLLLLIASATVLCQTPSTPATSSTANGGSPASVNNTSATSIQPDLDKLRTAATQAALDIERLRIDKWKASNEAKSAAQADADSVRRNLTTALPALIDAVRSAPADLNAEFKLYRNLNALYDVFGALTQATRSFGHQDDHEALAQQLQVIGSVRRKLGDTLEQLTAMQQLELNQMRFQIKAQQDQLAAAEAAAAKPKEVVVAQTEPPAKPKKKKSVPKKPATATSGSNSNSSNANPTGSAAAPATVPKS